MKAIKQNELAREEFKPTQPPGVQAVPAVTRSVKLLDAVAKSDQLLSLAELTKLLELPKSTVHALCATLCQLGLLVRLETGQYTMGVRVLDWAHAFISRINITEEFFKLWDQLSAPPEQTVTLSVMDGTHVVYVACRNGAKPLGVTFRVGMRMPAPFSATGKAMLSTISNEKLNSLFASDFPAPMTRKSVRDLQGLTEELQQCRVRGYSVDDEQLREGMICVGAPIFDYNGQEAVAGIAISVISTELKAKTLDSLGNMVRNVADKLSQRLGAPQSLMRS